MRTGEQRRDAGRVRFEDFFSAVTGNTPFDWQRRLADQVTQNDPARVSWPDLIELPTSAGKTSIQLIAAYALAVHPNAHRRIVYVIDRRTVADDAYETAHILRERLRRGDPALAPFAASLRYNVGLKSTEPLLETHLLRGGLGEPLARLRSPIAPTILVGTVDQLGSRLLFRGYGVSERMRPVAAGLLAYDTLWIVDEAHLSPAFLDTLRAVRASVLASPLPHDRPLHLIEMTATPRKRAGRTVFALGRPDDRIAQRISCSKPALIRDPIQTRDLVAAFAALVEEALGSKSFRRLGVIVNRVGLAREIFDALRKGGSKDSADYLLFIGPIRPYDRKLLYERSAAVSLKAQSHERRAHPVVAICTQTIEVGADIDFDALFVQAAPLDALRQRFGRHNRLGSSNGTLAIIVPELLEKVEPIYGDATQRTIRWLCSVAQRASSGQKVDFGIAAMDDVVGRLSPQELEALCSSGPLGEPLHVQHARNLARSTSPCIDEPDVSIFLHGEPARADVQLVWRELPKDYDIGRLSEEVKDDLSAAPPCAGEMLSIPVYAARSFLEGEKADVADVPAELESTRQGRRHGVKAIRWSPDKDQIAAVEPDQIRPGDTLVLPLSAGGSDEFGWSPDRMDSVSDLSLAAYFAKNGDRVRAARMRVLVAFDPEDGRTVTERVDDALTNKCESGDGLLEREIARVLMQVPKDQRTIQLIQAAGGNEHAWVTWRESVRDDEDPNADASSFTVRVGLTDHLEHVAARALDLAQRCGLLKELCEKLSLAGLLHDLGKADVRFQTVLRGGDLIGALRAEGQTENLLAKGLRRFAGGVQRSVAVPMSERWFPGMRHEAISVAMAGVQDPLVRHLIGSHHGFGRPTFPTIEDAAPRTVRARINGVAYEASSDHHLNASGWDEQFAALLDDYGIWGLAYLEAILRLADHRCSREEESGSVLGLPERDGGNSCSLSSTV
ncbi:type I-U CRISPR-associated helicase/endonuclease Cas3 [bacterium]|nr:MAG: type I-U CRISPR-associated helicase/endonuclease Cas3 [bacterium]